MDFVSKARNIPSGQWLSALYALKGRGKARIRFSISHSVADSDAQRFLTLPWGYGNWAQCQPDSLPDSHASSGFCPEPRAAEGGAGDA